MRRLPSVLVSLVMAALLPHCGGAAVVEPKTATNAPEDSTSDDRAEARGPSEDEAAGSREEKAKGPSCDDGTCSVCGTGICPSGWYCDESAPGGAACAWLKECADKASCGCVAKVLGPSCKCRDDGGIKVSCN